MSVLDPLLGIVVHECKPDVRLIKDPDRQRIPISDKHPLANVKLLLVDYQRVLDVLLDDPVASTAFADVLEDLVVVVEHNNATSAALMARFDDP